MFNDWDDDDLNLDEIFGKSQANSQHHVVSTRVENPNQGVPFQGSCSNTDNITQTRPTTSRSLAEQPVNIFQASSSSVPKSNDSASGPSKTSPEQISSIPKIQPSFSSDSSPRTPPPLARSDSSVFSRIDNRHSLDGQKQHKAIFSHPHPPPPQRLIQRLSPPPPQQRKRSASPSTCPSTSSSSAKQTKRRRSRFPGPAGRLGATENDGVVDEHGESESHHSTITALDPSTSATPPDVDGECLITLQRLINSFARLHPAAKRLLTSVANLDWLSQDLVFGSSLPDERVPLLAVAIKGIQLSTHLTVLRLRDVDGNEMNGIVWNAKVQDELAEKLIPGSSLLLKDSSAGYATRALVSQYVLLTQKTIAAASFVDGESQVQLFVNSAVEVVEGDFHRLNSVVEKSIADRTAPSEVSSSPKPRPSLFQSGFGEKRSPASLTNSSLFRGNSSNSSRNSSVNRKEAAASTSESAPPPTYPLPPPPSSSDEPKLPEKASSEKLNFDLGCDIDADTLSQMLDDDF